MDHHHDDGDRTTRNGIGFFWSSALRFCWLVDHHRGPWRCFHHHKPISNFYHYSVINSGGIITIEKFPRRRRVIGIIIPQEKVLAHPTEPPPSASPRSEALCYVSYLRLCISDLEVDPTRTKNRQLRKKKVVRISNRFL